MNQNDSGLKGSIWASRSHASQRQTYGDWEFRARSVPPRTPPPPAAAAAVTTSRTESIHLAAPAPATASSNAQLGPAQALQRFTQTCQRLRWKAIDLDNSYQRARDAAPHGFEPAHAERNFKIDFYEFYAWIEQALVLLQRVFGVDIEAGRNGSRTNHTYHHNVLKALEDDDNPLHSVLGEGDVNHALWKAKELRNSWKDAAGEGQTPPLGMYDLRWVVSQILAGLEAAYLRALEHVAAQNATMTPANGAGAVEEEGWDWMVDSMDWE
jgi:hypothetical protein